MEWDKSELAELNAFQQEWERMKEENEKLKTQEQYDKDFTDSLKEEVGTPILPNIVELKEKMEELEKENEKLKEFAMNVHNFAYGTSYNDPDIMDSVEDLDDIVDKLKKDEDTANEDLRDEIKELLDVIKALKEDLKETEEDTANEELEYLKKEHQKLRKKHEKLAVEFDELEEVASEIDDLDEQIEKLEKDNDKLEKEVSVLLAVASGDYNRADDFKALCKERFEEEFIDACDDDTLVGQYFTEQSDEESEEELGEDTTDYHLVK